MIPLLNARHSALFGWAVLILASLVLFWLSRGTLLYHIAAGFLVSVVALIIAMALFECVWQAAIYALRALGLTRP